MATPIFSNISLSYLFSACPIFLFLLFSSKKGYALDGGESTLQSHHHAVPVSFLLPAAVCSPSTKGGGKRGVSLKVVHRHGPCSQLSEDKASEPTLSQILSHDQSRVNSIQSRIGFNSAINRVRNSQANLPAKSGISIGTGNYIVTVGLGTPKKDLSLVFDTGSDLTWTQCQPCARSCYKQQEPTFDPSVSKTYKNITCSSTQCSQLISSTGTKPACSSTTCIYGIQYGDQSFSVGFFGSETLALTRTDVFPNFKFGCGQNNQGLFGGSAGILGLGRDPLSLVSQTASKYGKYFSYCLPSKSSSTGHLTFGKGRKSSALKSTPLLTNPQGPSFYYIDIMDIKVGGQKLGISQTVFKTAGAIIDSGTVITRLPPDAYAALRSAFRQGMKQYPLLSKGVSILDTCYDLSNYTTVSVPTVSFGFGGNVEVEMDFSGILYGTSLSQICLAFAGNSDAGDLGIFGNVQQRTLEVVYDVAGGKLGFSTGKCS